MTETSHLEAFSPKTKERTQTLPHSFENAITENEHRLKIAENNSQELLEKLMKNHALFSKVDGISQTLFQKSITELEAQELGALLVDYSKGSAKTFIDSCAKTKFNKDFQALSSQEQAQILKEYLYDKEESLSKNFFSSILFSETFENIDNEKKMRIAKRVRRLASVTQLNKVFLERKRVRAKTKDNTLVRGEFISSGERFLQAVVEKNDVMAFLVFGVPMSECSKSEQSFIEGRLVQDLENNLKIYSDDDFFENIDLKFLLGKLSEVKKAFYEEQGEKYKEKYTEGYPLVDPKSRPKLVDLQVQVGKGIIAKEQSGPNLRNITVYLDGANSKTAQALVQLMNQGYSQEEALLYFDESIACESLRDDKEKTVSVFLVEQSLKRNKKVQIEWSSVGENVVMVINDGKIQYDSTKDTSTKEHLGSVNNPACISNQSIEVPQGTEILILPKVVYETLDHKKLVRVIEESQGESSINIGDLDKRLASKGIKNIQKIIAGKTTMGNNLEYLERKTDFSNFEWTAIQDLLTPFLKNIEGKKVSLEASHIYAHLAFGLEHALGAQIASAVTQRASENNIHCTSKLFIDDFNTHGLNCIGRENDENNRYSPENLNQHGGAFLEKIQEQGFDPSIIVWEADQVTLAENSLKQLDKQGLTEQKEEHVYLKGTTVKLYDTKRKIFTCACLDAMRCAKELEENDYTITILPDFYDGQQEDMKLILEALGYDHSKIINIFFNTTRVYVRKGEEIQELDLIKEKIPYLERFYDEMGIDLEELEKEITETEIATESRLTPGRKGEIKNEFFKSFQNNFQEEPPTPKKIKPQN